MEETEYQKKEFKWDGINTVGTAKGYGESYIPRDKLQWEKM